MAPHKALVDAAFAVIEQAAMESRACPRINSTLDGEVPYSLAYALAKAGRIRFEISGRADYAQAFILTGRHAGKCTAANPTNSKVWRVIDRRGARYGRGTVSREQPNRPAPMF